MQLTAAQTSAAVDCTRLVEAARDDAARAAGARLRVLGYQTSQLPDGLVTELCEALRVELRDAFEQAMLEAGEALDAGMEQVALATFSASIRLVGIRAANRAHAACQA